MTYSVTGNASNFNNYQLPIIGYQISPQDLKRLSEPNQGIAQAFTLLTGGKVFVDDYKNTKTAFEDWIYDILLLAENFDAIDEEERETRMEGLEKVGPKNSARLLLVAQHLAQEQKKSGKFSETISAINAERYFTEKLHELYLGQSGLLDLKLDETEIDADFVESLKADKEKTADRLAERKALATVTLVGLSVIALTAGLAKYLSPTKVAPPTCPAQFDSSTLPMSSVDAQPNCPAESELPTYTLQQRHHNFPPASFLNRILNKQEDLSRAVTVWQGVNENMNIHEPLTVAERSSMAPMAVSVIGGLSLAIILRQVAARDYSKYGVTQDGEVVELFKKGKFYYYKNGDGDDCFYEGEKKWWW